MHQSPFMNHTMVHVIGNYQPNGQFPSVQNHGYYASSPTNLHHQDFVRYNRSTPSNHNRHRFSTQQGSYPFDFLQRLNAETQSINYCMHNGANPNNWQRLNSPNRNPVTPQRLHTPNNMVVTPIQSRHHSRPMSSESGKKNPWNYNNKFAKKHSCQDLPQLRDAQSSDSGFSSRSPTPNKHQRDGSQAESSDERDSVMSMSLNSSNSNMSSNSTISNMSSVSSKAARRNDINKANIVTSASTGNLHQITSFPAITAKPVFQNHQNKKKFLTANKTSPNSQRAHRGKKFVNNIVSEIQVSPNPKFYYSPADRFIEKSYLVQTRHKPQNLLTGSVYDKLSNAIWEKFEKNQLTQATFCHKMYLWRFLFFFIKEKFPYCGLYMVGSTMNGFGCDGSDVDMCLIMRENHMVDYRTDAIYRLSQIMSILKRNEYINHLELIQAKVPILKIRDNKYDLDVDLNFNCAVGIRNTHLMYCYSRIDWRVRPLVLVVKLWAQCQNINDARQMTISSYSLVLMVIHFLQCGVTPAVLPCLHRMYKYKFHPNTDIHTIDVHEELNIQSNLLPKNTQTLGELLIEFFKYYDSFDYDQYAISVRLADKIPIDRCRFVRTYKNDPHQWKYLCIEEPFDLTNTARSVYDPEVFQMIKETFKQTYKRLQESRDLSTIFKKLDVTL